MHETVTFRVQTRSANHSIGRSFSVLPTIVSREAIVSIRHRKWTNLTHSWYTCISLRVISLFCLFLKLPACQVSFSHVMSHPCRQPVDTRGSTDSFMVRKEIGVTMLGI